MIKQLVKPLLTGKGPDFSDLTAQKRYVGNYQLGYKLPGNPVDIGKPKKPTPERVNLKPDLFKSYNIQQRYNRTFVQMEFAWWAYRGLFLQGCSGKLSEMSMTIDVNQVEPHITLQEDNLDSLEIYLKKDIQDYYEAEQNKDGNPGVNWKARYEFEHPDEVRANGYIPLGRLVLVAHLPDTYYRESINGVEWLHYSIRGEGVGHGRSFYWACPLSASHFLTLGFWMTSEIGDEDLRYQRMLEDAKRIMSMVELTKD